MARRSPMNPRYQKDAQVGATRKSAASAKPKRSASSGSSSSSSSSKKNSQGGSARIELPPQTKKLQRLVFICLGIAVAISAIYLWRGTSLPRTVGSISIGVSYGLLFFALYVDFTRVRPVTRALRNGEPVPDKPPLFGFLGKPDDKSAKPGAKPADSDKSASKTTDSEKTGSDAKGKDA